MGRRPPAIFVGDAPGLDFLNSIATPIDTPVDWIDDGEGLLSWLGQARLVPAEALESMRAHALPGELDKVADQARRLREWFRGFVRQHKGRPLAAAALAQLEPLNRLLERDEVFGRIIPRPAAGTGLSSFRWSAGGGPRGPSAPDRGGAGTACLRGGFLKREGLRGPCLHAFFCRPHARSRATVVQHGDMWEPGEAGSAPPPHEGASATDRRFRLLNWPRISGAHFG